MFKFVQATINVSIVNENLDIDEICDQIDGLGWSVDSAIINHSDWDEGKED